MSRLLGTQEVGKFRTICQLTFGSGGVLEIREGFGERLRDLRLQRRLSQKELAHPYSGPFVSQLETGRKMPSAQVLALFAKKLGVTPEELAFGPPSTYEPQVTSHLQVGWSHLYSGDLPKAERAFKTARRLARQANLHASEADAAAGIARCFERRGQNDDAMREYEKALSLYREHAATPAAAEAVAGIARCHQMRGKTRLALHVLEDYLLELEIRALPDPAALMRIYASLVWPYSELGLYDQASEAATNALKLQHAVQDPEEIGRMHLNVARALLNSGRSNEALTSLKRAEEIFRDLNWRTEIARAQTNRGIVLMNRGELAAARESLEEASETFRALGLTRSEARNLNELARLERLSGHPDKGEALARRGLELLNEMEAVPELALAHRELGLCLRDSDTGEAERHFRVAIELYERCDEVDHAVDTHRLLGDLLERREPQLGVASYRAGLLLIRSRLDRDD